jgi:flagellar hook-associated protein 2
LRAAPVKDSGSEANMVTATGLGSGLDIGGLVTQLVSAERAGSDLQLNRKSSKLNAKLSAFGSLKSSIAAFKGAQDSLNSLSSYDKKSVTLSSSDAFTAIATASAVPNSYSIEVQQLATTHALASGTFADSDSTAVGTGTLTFRFGTVDYNTVSGNLDGFTLNDDSKITTLTIDSSNNTLEGIMQAVNDADFGVKASVVNDGGGYRLLFTSTNSGAENGIEIQVSDTDTNNADNLGLSRLAFNTTASHVSQTKAAEDAEFTLNGLPVTSASNTVTSAIPGVTLNLKKVSADPVQMTVNKDTASVTAAVNSFISGYNTFARTVRTLTKYDPATKTAGMLLGDFTVRAVVSQVDNIMRDAVAGIVGEFGSLAEVGMKTNNAGEYELDTAKFKAALESSPQSIQALFTALGVPSDNDIKYLASSALTEAGSYAVNVSTLASSGSYTAAGVLPADFGATPLVINADNDAFSIEVDGLDVGEVLLTQGSYSSGSALATEIQARINGSTAMVDAGKTVSVTYDSGANRFVIASAMVGNSSIVNFTAVDTNSAAELGFSVADGVAGQDVAGSINGVAATGAGKLLSAGDTTGARGLQLEIGGSVTGARGSIAFSRGISSQLELLLEKVLGEESSLTDRIDNINNGIKDVAKRREQMEVRWEQVKDRYTRQFNALDTMLSGLQSTSKYLETQLAALPGANRG